MTLLFAIAAVLMCPSMPSASSYWQLKITSTATKQPQRKPIKSLRVLAVVGVTAALLLVLGWRWGGLLAVSAVPWTWRVLSPRKPLSSALPDIAPQDAPDMLALLSALARSGMDTRTAVNTVAAATPGALGRELTIVARAQALGVPPTQAWERLHSIPATTSLADVMTRTVESGAPISESLDRLAHDARQEALATAQTAARAVGVRVIVPLGFCYLPSFVLLAVVPVVGSLAAGMVSF